MNEDRVEGAAKTMGGKLEEGVGRVTGDVKTQVEGTMKQAVGTAQDLYGQARENCRGRGRGGAPTSRKP